MVPCGEDDRQEIDSTIWPGPAIVKLWRKFDEDDEPRGCTGFFIGPHTVITNGHCLYNKEIEKFVVSVEVVPGLNGEE